MVRVVSARQSRPTCVSELFGCLVGAFPPAPHRSGRGGRCYIWLGMDRCVLGAREAREAPVPSDLFLEPLEGVLDVGHERENSGLIGVVVCSSCSSRHPSILSPVDVLFECRIDGPLV